MKCWTRGIALLVTFVAFTGCAGDAESEADGGEPAAAESTPTQTDADPGIDEPTGDADAAPGNTGGTVNPLMNPADPEMNHMAPATFRVRLTTSKGEVLLELTRAWSPQGVDRVYNLVRGGFFDGVRFFRVLDGFIAQFGINGDPAVQARWRAANIVDEPVVEGNLRGRLTFAKGGPNTRSTQLFINFQDNSSNLDGLGFPALGEVVEGMDVLEALYSGYGEGYPRGPGPNQATIQQQGNEYLAADFPELDYIEKAEIVN